MSTVDLATARKAKASLVAVLSPHASVSGIGIAVVKGGYALKVDLVDDRVHVSIPEEIDGVDVQVDITGIGRPQDTNPV